MGDPERDPSDKSTADSQPVGSVTDDGRVVTTQSNGGAAGGTLTPSAIRNKLWALGVGVGLGFGSTVVSLILVVGLIVTLGVFAVPLPDSPLVLLSIEFILGQLIVMGGISVAYLWATGRQLSYVNIRWPSLGELLVVLAAPFAVIAVSIAVSAIGLALNIESSPHALAEIDNIDATFYLYLIPFMLLIVGPFEELLYRGVIQTRLRESFGPASAIALASLIFVLIHLPAYGLGQEALPAIAISLTALFGGSLIFGAIYEWTGNLTVVALIHGLYNSILLALLYVVTVYEDELMELSEQATVLLGL